MQRLIQSMGGWAGKILFNMRACESGHLLLLWAPEHVARRRFVNLDGYDTCGGVDELLRPRHDQGSRQSSRFSITPIIFMCSTRGGHILVLFTSSPSMAHFCLDVLEARDSCRLANMLWPESPPVRDQGPSTLWNTAAVHTAHSRWDFQPSATP